MKKLLALLALLIPGHVKAILSIEADASAFFPTNSTVNEIYGNVWSDFGITLDHIYPLPNKLPHVAIFAQGDYIQSTGKSINGNQSTKIQLIPITVGLKWIQKTSDSIEFYLALAPKYYFMQINNKSQYVPHIVHDNGCGGYASIGSFFYPVNNLMIDLFFSYSYMKFSASQSTSSYTGLGTDVSGLNLGGGIGWKF